MRPRSYARKPTDAHTSSRTHSRTYTYIHPRMHMYARIRAREGNFLTSNLLYSIVKQSSFISPTPFTSIIQSLYNPYQYWNHIGGVICTNCQHLSPIYNNLPTIPQPFNHFSLISQIISHLLSIHHLARIIFHLYPISNLTNLQSYQYVSML